MTLKGMSTQPRSSHLYFRIDTDYSVTKIMMLKKQDDLVVVVRKPYARVTVERDSQLALGVGMAF